MIALLSRFADRPIVAWCDLDADGINIVADLTRRLGRPVSTVGMTTALWSAGPYRTQNPDHLRRGRDLAGTLAHTGHEELRKLAEAIALTGEEREQETMYEDFLPDLPKALHGPCNNSCVGTVSVERAAAHVASGEGRVRR